MTSYHVAIDGIQTNDAETLRILVNKLAVANETLRARLAAVRELCRAELPRIYTSRGMPFPMQILDLCGVDDEETNQP